MTTRFRIFAYVAAVLVALLLASVARAEPVKKAETKACDVKTGKGCLVIDSGSGSGTDNLILHTPSQQFYVDTCRIDLRGALLEAQEHLSWAYDGLSEPSTLTWSIYYKPGSIPDLERKRREIDIRIHQQRRVAALQERVRDVLARCW